MRGYVHYVNVFISRPCDWTQGIFDFCGLKPGVRVETRVRNVDRGKRRPTVNIHEIQHPDVLNRIKVEF